MANHTINFKLAAIPNRPGIFIVGGALRDRLLGRNSVDIDIAVQGNPQKLAEQIAERTHSRVIPLGQHTHPLFRVVTPSHTIDITRLQGDSINTDLRRRDFTINALAYEVCTHSVIDVTRGINDIHDRLIRRVSHTCFQDDPLRLLRAYRLASQLDFQIEDDTRRALHQDAVLISNPAVERIQAELMSILAGPRVHYWLTCMADATVLFQILPELTALVGCRQDRRHAFDVFEHTMQTLQTLEKAITGTTKPTSKIISVFGPVSARRRIRLHLAALLHDIGKPVTRQESSSGQIQFAGHEITGTQMTAEIGLRLRLPHKEIESIAQLVRHHLKPLHVFKAFKRNQLGAKGLTRFFVKTKGFTGDLLMLSLADMRAKAIESQKKFQAFEAFMAQVADQYAREYKPRSVLPPLINGDDLIHSLGLTPGPQFKEILKHVREAQLSGQITSPKEALVLAAEIVSQIHTVSSQR